MNQLNPELPQEKPTIFARLRRQMVRAHFRILIFMHFLRDRNFEILTAAHLIWSFFLAVIILAINCYSVNLATSVMNLFTAAKLLAIAIVIGAGMYKLFEG